MALRRRQVVSSSESSDEDGIRRRGSGNESMQEGPSSRKRSPDECAAEAALKKPKVEMLDDTELEPLSDDRRIVVRQAPIVPADPNLGKAIVTLQSRQFWKAGENISATKPQAQIIPGMDRSRLHPKFLHSNATSHKWALGAIAELLDNALDEVANGATYVSVDIVKSPKDGTAMLLVEDNGGGMNPDRLRQCMSFGYSEKSTKANTIGQYGNGFKTSTMRLGADCIVFTRSPSRDGQPATRSVGLLSYSFLLGTQQDDILVPMVDWEDHQVGDKLVLKPSGRSSEADLEENLSTIINWGPYSSEVDIKNQFKKMKSQGTRVVVYNLWEDDKGGLPELDFATDPTDIQVPGLREDAKVEMASTYPSSKYYISYTYSLRTYASILYLRLPSTFRMILRGKEIEHYDMGKDLLYRQSVIYKPKCAPGGEAFANVSLGFIKDAVHHIDVQGFNVYHKNRLIKPFWRIWNTPSSQGRGAVGLLEANFVEPAHNKQGFELTRFLKRLEGKLLRIQKLYWNSNSHKVGYHTKKNVSPVKPKPKKPDRKYLTYLPSPPADEPESADSPGSAEAAENADVEDNRNKGKEDDPKKQEVGKKITKCFNKTLQKSELRRSTRTIPTKPPVKLPTKAFPGRIRRTSTAGQRYKTMGKAPADVPMEDEPSTSTSFDSSDGEEKTTTSADPLNENAEAEALKKEVAFLKRSLAEAEARKSDLETRLKVEASRNNDLEAKLESMELSMSKLHDDLMQEHSYKAAVELELEERKKSCDDDEELRRQLKNALLRVRELEMEKQQLLEQQH